MKSVYPVKVKYFVEGLIDGKVEKAIVDAIKSLGYVYDGSGACVDGEHGRDLYFAEKKTKFVGKQNDEHSFNQEI